MQTKFSAYKISVNKTTDLARIHTLYGTVGSATPSNIVGTTNQAAADPPIVNRQLHQLIVGMALFNSQGAGDVNLGQEKHEHQHVTLTVLIYAKSKI